MIDIERKAILPHSAEQIFDMINDIERYPEFVSVCKSVKILHRSAGETKAVVEVAGVGMQKQMVAHNQHQRPYRVLMTQESGPFKSLVGSWSIEPSDNSCKVTAHVSIELRSRLLATMAAALAPKIADQLVVAMQERAKLLYG